MPSEFEMSFDEWTQERDALTKAPARGGAMSPISPYAATTPGGTFSSGKPLNTPPSQYATSQRTQPQSWIDDVDDLGDIYSPLQPLLPFGPPAVREPRMWDYPIGYNLNYVPARMQAMEMFEGMRGSWGVLATIIATRQDQLLRLPWTIQRKDKPKQASAGVDEIKKFLKKPDGRYRYSQWAMLILDDLLVLDAPAIYFMRDRAGRPIHAVHIQGKTIFPLIDDMGMRPTSGVRLSSDGLMYMQRQPAFQQIIKGMPLVDFDESELMYVPMRPRPSMPMFGYPGTEQILVEASEAIRKTFYQLAFWAEGTIPDLVVTVPEAWSPRQIAMFQAHFDAMLAGNISLKSKVRFLPGGMKPFDIKNSSGESLWSQRDETLIRLACYAYSINPTPFIKQVNRSVAQNSQQTADQEGLYPLMAYWKENIIDPIIQEKFGYEDIEFIFLPRPESDLQKQAEVHDLQVKRGLRSRNEVRGDMGFEPVDGGDAYTIELGNAIVTLEDAANGLALPNLRSEQFPAPGGRFATASSNSPAGSPPPPANTPQRGTPAPTHAAPVAKLSSIEVDDAAQMADGDVSRHSHARLSAGNYRKGHISLGGLNISIENALGSTRGKRNPDGSLRWSAEMAAHYGYIRGTVGADGDQVDVFIGRRPDLTSRAWVIDQAKTSKKGNLKFDEHKIMLGYASAKKALKDYRKSYGDRVQIAGVTEISLSDLKRWLQSGNLNKPIAGRFGSSIDFAKADTISSDSGLLGRRKKRRWKDSGRYDLHTV